MVCVVPGSVGSERVDIPDWVLKPIALCFECGKLHSISKVRMCAKCDLWYCRFCRYELFGEKSHAICKTKECCPSSEKYDKEDMLLKNMYLYEPSLKYLDKSLPEGSIRTPPSLSDLASQISREMDTIRYSEDIPELAPTSQATLINEASIREQELAFGEEYTPIADPLIECDYDAYQQEFNSPTREFTENKKARYF